VKALWKRAPTWVKWVAGVFVLLLIIGIANGGGESNTGASSSEPTTATNAPKPPPQKINPQGQPKLIAEQQFGAKLRSVETEGNGRGTGVYVVFLEDENSLESEMEDEMIDAYRAYFDSSSSPAFVQLAGQVHLVDKYGHKLIGPGWTTRMSRAIGDQVQWDESDYLDFEEIWSTILKRDDL
jgi:hypothetical protein